MTLMRGNIEMRPRTQRTILLLVLIGVPGLWLAIRKTDPFQTEVHSLQKQTCPPTGRTIRAATLNRTMNAASAEWECEIDWPWGQYTNWLGRTLDVKYARVEASESRLTFRCVSSGDVFFLEIERTQVEAVSRIHARWRAEPD